MSPGQPDQERFPDDLQALFAAYKKKPHSGDFALWEIAHFDLMVRFVSLACLHRNTCASYNFVLRALVHVPPPSTQMYSLVKPSNHKAPGGAAAAAEREAATEGGPNIELNEAGVRSWMKKLETALGNANPAPVTLDNQTWTICIKEYAVPTPPPGEGITGE